MRQQSCREAERGESLHANPGRHFVFLLCCSLLSLCCIALRIAPGRARPVLRSAGILRQSATQCSLKSNARQALDNVLARWSFVVAGVGGRSSFPFNIFIVRLTLSLPAIFTRSIQLALRSFRHCHSSFPSQQSFPRHLLAASCYYCAQTPLPEFRQLLLVSTSRPHHNNHNSEI